MIQNCNHNPWMVASALALGLTMFAGCDQEASDGQSGNQTVLIGTEAVAGMDKASLGDEPLEAAEGMRVVDVNVEGMFCEHNCAPQVQAVLVQIPGVDAVRVSVANKHAWVRVPADAALEAKDVANMINEKTTFEATAG